MSIQDVTLATHLWHRGAFPDETIEQLGLCLAEETGELIRCILKKSHGMNDRRADIDWDAELYTECGDVLVALSCIIERNGWDIEDVLRSRLAYVSKRFPSAKATR